MSSKFASGSRLALSRFFLAGGGNKGCRIMSSLINHSTLGATALQRVAACATQQQPFSTYLQPAEDTDYCSLDENARELDEIMGLLTESDKRRREERPAVVGREIIPFHSASAKTISWILRNDDSVDKVIICMRYGESEHNLFEEDLRLQGKDLEQEMLHNEDYPRDPILSKRVSRFCESFFLFSVLNSFYNLVFSYLIMQGFGQALNNARKIADCCNNDTMLIPELVVVSPLKRATMAALLSFPRHSPLSVRNTKWICHPGLIEMTNSKNPADFISPAQDLSACFPGIDYSLLFDHEGHNARKINRTALSEAERKMDLLARADNFLSWLQGRNERVIVGKYALSMLFQEI